MDYFKIFYRDKEYLIEELMGESNKLLKELSLPENYLADFFITDFGLVFDKGYAIAGEKFYDLYNVLSSARFALFNAHLKIHKDQVKWESGYIETLWVRSQYLKNSILWYNSCRDYIMQIIWFAFDFYSDISNYSKEMRKCSFEIICKKLDNYKNYPNASSLLSHLRLYHNDKDVVYINKLANLLKHKQMVNIKGLDTGRFMAFKSKSFSSDILEKEVIDIDVTIEQAKNVHIKTIEMGTFLLNFIDFKKMFVLNEKGAILMDKSREKPEYKKIIINEDYAT